MRAVEVEVITYAPTVFAHCQHCELTFGHVGLGERFRRDQASESLPEDLRREYSEVSSWVHDLRERFGPRLRIKVVDVASIQGVSRPVAGSSRSSSRTGWRCKAST